MYEDTHDITAATTEMLLGRDPKDLASLASDLRQYTMHLRDQSFGIRAQTAELKLRMRTKPTRNDQTEAISPPGQTNLPKKVSIIIPTRGDVKVVWDEPRCLAEAAMRSVLQVTNYPDFEIVLVLDDPHTAPNSLLDLCQTHSVTVVNFTKPFNFSEKCNVGFLASSGEIVVLLNDDVEITDPEWLSTLVGLLDDPTVGMVGPLLLLEDGRVQSAGHGMSPTPHNLLAGVSLDDPEFAAVLGTTRETSGVTAACAAIRAEVYEEMGGMTLDLPINFNDIDFGLKLLESGYRILWTPKTFVYHFESLTREVELGPRDEHHLRRRWARYFTNDPHADVFSALQQQLP